MNPPTKQMGVKTNQTSFLRGNSSGHSNSYTKQKTWRRHAIWQHDHHEPL